MKGLYHLLLSGLLLCLSPALFAQELSVMIGDATGNVGQPACVKINGSDFDRITTAQFTISYDPAVLTYVSASGNFGGSTVFFGHNTNSPGVIRLVWSPISSTGYTDAGPFEIGELCFTVAQSTATDIRIIGTPVPIDFTNEDGDEFDADDISIDNGTINGGSGGGTPTCSDGVQNGNETGVDCGGSCTPCMVAPTCSDGVQNGNETGVDCGGSCAPCSTGGGTDCGVGSNNLNFCFEELCNVPQNGPACLELFATNYANVAGFQATAEFTTGNLFYQSITTNPDLENMIEVAVTSASTFEMIYVQDTQAGITVADGTSIATICFTNQTTNATTIRLTNITAVDNNNQQFSNPVGNAGSINDCSNPPTPTCTDGIRNGTETGIDCGGNCTPCMTGGGDAECGANSNNLNFCFEDLCNVAANGQACLELSATNYIDIAAFQATVAFTTGNLAYQSITTNPALENMVEVAVTSASTLEMVYVQDSQSGITVPDGTTIATICFTNQTAAATTIGLTNIRAVDNNNQQITNPVSNPGSVNDCTVATPTCTDGIQNGNETGIDCGGSCSPCQTMTGCGAGSDDVTICMGSVCGEVGTEICVPVMVGNFDDLAGFQFRFTYPAGNLNYTRFIGAGALQSGFSDGGTPSDGELGIVWSEPTTTATDFPNDQPAIELCFTVENNDPSPFTYVNGSVLAFDDQGASVMATANSGGINIAANCNTGGNEVCGTGSSNFNICGGEACSIAVGSEACIDLTVANFTDVTALQAKLTYPAANLNFSSITGNASIDQVLGNQTADGSVTIFYEQPAQTGVTLSDGDVFATVCFTNETAAATTIQIENLIVNATSGPLPNPIGNPGAVNGCVTAPTCNDGIRNGNETGIDCGGSCAPCMVTPTCNDGIQNGNETGVDCGGSCEPCDPVSFDNITFRATRAVGTVGQEVCIDIEGYKLIDIAALQFAVRYDTSKVQLLSAESTGLLPGMSIQSPTAGQVRAVWFDPSLNPTTVPEGAAISRLCFRILQACNTPIEFFNPPQSSTNVSDSNGETLTPLDTVNGSINRDVPCGGGGGSPDNLVLNLGTANGTVGQEICLPLTVTDFDNLNQLSFSINYDAASVRFSRAANFGLGSVTAANVDSGTAGVLSFNWSNTGGQSIADGGKLLDLCFDIDRLAASTVNFANSPTPITAGNAAGQTVGVVQNNGSINPGAPVIDGLTLQIGSTTGAVGETVCLPVIGYDVIDLNAFQYTINYDNNLLRYTGTGDDFALVGLSNNSINNSSPGVLSVTWNDPGANGNTLASGTALYTICFEVLSTDQAVVSFGGTPVAIEFTIDVGNNDELVTATLINGQVNGSAAPSIVGAQLDPPSCSDGNDGSIDLTVSGGGNLNYLWQPNVSTSDKAENLAAGVYNVTITNRSTSQSTTGQYTLTAPAPFSVEAESVMGVSCRGESDGSITVRTVGGAAPFTVDWSGSLSDNQLTQSGLDGGSYSVTVTDNNGCAKSLTNIMIAEPGEVRIGGTIINIDGSTPGGVNVIVEGGSTPYNYAWTGPGSYTATSEDISNASVAGTYCLTVTDNRGCTDQECFMIQTELNILSTSPQIVSGCAGDNNGSIDITPSGGSGNYNFTWSFNGQEISNMEDLSGLQPGDYSVTVTSGNQTKSGVFTVDTPTPIILPASVTPASEGSNGAIDLTPGGGNPNYTIRWSTGATTQDLTGLSSGEYCVTVTDEIGCRANACYNVRAAAFAFVSATTNGASCGNTDDGEIRLVLANGQAPFSISIEPLGISRTVEERTISISAPPGTYQVVIEDGQSERITEEVVVTGPSAIVATPTLTSDTQDEGCSGMISLQLAGGTGPYTVAWSNGANGASISQLCAGDYQATVTDANGCPLVTPMFNISNLGQELISSTPTACEDGNEGAVVVRILGGVQPYTFSWADNSTSEIVSTSKDLTGVGPGEYTLTLTDATQARVVKSYTVDVASGFSISTRITSDYNGFNVSCPDANDGRIVVEVSGQDTYTYQFMLNETVVGADSILNDAAAGVYTVSVLDGGGCELTRRVELTAPPALEVTAEIDNETCNDENDGRISASVTGGVGPYTYAWVNGASGMRIQALSSGVYGLTVADRNGCELEEEFTVASPDDLAVTLQPTAATDGCNGSVLIIPLGGSGDYTFEWPQLPMQDMNSTLAEGLCPGDYQVIVTDLNGCQSVTMSVTVEDRRFPCLSVREVITPNEDGSNDAFVIFCSDGEEANGNNLEVYNRWGQLVFEMENYACSTSGGLNCFEGQTNDGSILPAGPYYYIFNFRNAIGEEMQQRGSLTIIRD